MATKMQSATIKRIKAVNHLIEVPLPDVFDKPLWLPSLSKPRLDDLSIVSKMNREDLGSLEAMLEYIEKYAPAPTVDAVKSLDVEEFDELVDAWTEAENAALAEAGGTEALTEVVLGKSAG